MMPQPGLWSNSMHFQVLMVLTSPMSGKSKKSYWQAFSYAGPIHEAFFHRGSVPLESNVADALE